MITLGEFLARGQAAQEAVDREIERATGIPHRREAEPSYSVGDFVWVNATGNRHELARIELGRPNVNGNTWQVRVRRPKGWPLAPVWKTVIRALTPAELEHNRRLGLIPQPGESL